jgi:hypothetical protein
LRRVTVTPVTARTTLETTAGLGTTPQWQERAYTDHLRSALKRANASCRAASAEHLEPEHLLLGLLDEPECQAVDLLSYTGVDVASLRLRLVRTGAAPAEVAPS